MITERMTLDEIYRELEADKAEVKDKIFTPYRMNALKRSSMSRRDKPTGLSFFVNTSRRNRYVCFIAVKDWKEFCKGEIHQYWMAVYNTQKGKYAAHVGHSNILGKEVDTLSRYQPHFFSRYAERMRLDLRGEELILRFLIRNNIFTLHVNPLNRNPKEVFAASHEGLSLGYIEKNDIKFNTFISYDDLGKTKYEISQKELEYLRDMLTAKFGSFVKTKEQEGFYTSHDMMMDVIERTLTDTDIRPSERNARTFKEGDHRNAVFEMTMRKIVKEAEEKLKQNEKE